jgi:hypothetical protein
VVAFSTPTTASAKFFFTYLILKTFMNLPLKFLQAQPGVVDAWIRCGLRPRHGVGS